MKSLEKYMFFIPNRLYAVHKEMFVSFNVAVIPVDMTVTSLVFRLPLPDRSLPMTLYIHEIAGGWDEQSIRTIIPSHDSKLRELTVHIGMKEAIVDLTDLEAAWRFESLENHGIYVRVHSPENIRFTEENPPYLLVATV